MKDFEDLSILTDFTDLGRGDKVYSKCYGLGEVFELYGKEVIVDFPTGRFRIWPDDKDLSFVAKRSRNKGRIKSECFVDGERVSFAKLKNTMKQDTIEDFIPLQKVIYVIGLRKSKVIKLCAENNIEVTRFGITKSDFLKLNNIVFKK